MTNHHAPRDSPCQEKIDSYSNAKAQQRLAERGVHFPARRSKDPSLIPSPIERWGEPQHPTSANPSGGGRRRTRSFERDFPRPPSGEPSRPSTVAKGVKQDVYQHYAIVFEIGKRKKRPEAKKVKNPLAAKLRMERTAARLRLALERFREPFDASDACSLAAAVCGATSETEPRKQYVPRRSLGTRRKRENGPEAKKVQRARKNDKCPSCKSQIVPSDRSTGDLNLVTRQFSLVNGARPFDVLEHGYCSYRLGKPLRNSRTCAFGRHWLRSSTTSLFLFNWLVTHPLAMTRFVSRSTHMMLQV